MTRYENGLIAEARDHFDVDDLIQQMTSQERREI